MNVYITYDRYEHDEWHYIYRLETNKKRAIRLCKLIDLPSFIGYGPDDCHSFQIQVINMTPDEYHWLRDLVDKTNDSSIESSEKDKELYDFMVELFDKAYDGNVILSTDGCSDWIEMIRYYAAKLGLDPEDDDAFYEAEEKLQNNEELSEQIMKEYIKYAY